MIPALDLQDLGKNGLSSLISLYVCKTVLLGCGLICAVLRYLVKMDWILIEKGIIFASV